MHPAVRRSGAALEGRPTLPTVFKVIDESCFTAFSSESDCAVLDIVGCNRNGVLRDGLEVGHVCAGGCHREGIGGCGAYRCAVLRPVDEVVTCVGRGRQRAGCTVLKAAATAYSTAIGRVGRGSDDVRRTGHIGERGLGQE